MSGAAGAGPRRILTLGDSVGLIVGIIVGAGIFQVAPDVARGVPGAAALLGLWLAGGIVSLFGALGYAELAAAYPEAGGDYAYLTRAYGPRAGFLFGWLQLSVVRPGDIAVMAFAFATYAAPVAEGWLGRPIPQAGRLFAALAVALLTLVNIAGVRSGVRTQNALTLLKGAGLLAVTGLALAAPSPAAVAGVADPLPASVALILVLFTYGGWNEMAYVAAEVRDPGRNVLRALVLGTAAVTVLYLAANAAFLHARGGRAGLASATAVAAEAVAPVLPGAAAWVAALVCVSTLGAVNGLILAGARISYAVGADHAMFRPLGAWNGRTGTPVRALAVQGVLAVALVLVLGSFTGTLLYTAAPVYLFYLATSVAVGVLRRRDPGRPRPVRAWGYPFTTAVFCAVCAWLAWQAVAYRPAVAAVALGVLAAGIPLYAISRRRTVSDAGGSSPAGAARR
ncbi:MAG: amino acid permease [Lentisphaerae bacterium]|nr:amino acid permease [Lentisphaerota bacterium]